ADFCVKYRLIGEVQNVGFRQYLSSKSGELGVRGWAKNESDGSLVALFCGEESAVSEMISHLRPGPIGASVQNMAELLVEEDDMPPPGEFEIR
ncbi:MAG: acylphosphatase, partial [Gammaproteobacteria bacterium]